MLQTQCDQSTKNTLTQPRLSICIVNWNTRDYLYDCLRSIQKAKHSVNFEIIVVDNASSDDSASMLQLMFPKIKKIINKDNLGYAMANNQAMRVAQGEYVLLLNPDTVVPDDVFDVLVEKMDADSSIGVISCQLRNMDGSIQRFCSGLPNIKDEIFIQAGFDRRYPNHIWAGHRSLGYFDYTLEQDVEQPPGTFLFTRKSVIQTIGGFDEQFPIFFNDVDWCKQVIEAGWRIVFTPDTYIYHHKSASIKKQFAKSLTDAFFMRKQYYLKHFGGLITRLLSWFAPFRANSMKSLLRKKSLKNQRKILLIKSSYDEHFDSFIKNLSKQFPDVSFDLLSTKTEDSERYAKYFSNCITYQGSSNWISLRHTDKTFLNQLQKSNYTGVFFPHATVDGAGYWNIVFFACALRCNILGAYGVDGGWHVFSFRKILTIRGLFVYGTAYLLLLIGYVREMIGKTEWSKKYGIRHFSHHGEPQR